MKGMFGARRGSRRDREPIDEHTNSDEPAKRKSFAFMKYGGNDRRSSTQVRADREHARRIAMQLSLTDDDDAQQPVFPAPAAMDTEDFNPFGHNGFGESNFSASNSNSSMSFHDSARSFQSSAAQPAPPPPPTQRSQITNNFAAQQADYSESSSSFADFDAFGVIAANSHFTTPQKTPVPPSSTPSSRRGASSSATSQAPLSSRTPVQPQHDHIRNSFDEQASISSSGAAFDADFLTFSSKETSSTNKSATRGRPPKPPIPPESAPSSTAFHPNHWPYQQQQQYQQQQVSQHTPPPPVSSHTPPPPQNNHNVHASLHSSFLPQRQVPAVSPPPSIVSSSSGGAGGAAARRRMRSQMRSSGISSVGSDCGGSVNGEDTTPPASPASSHSRPPAGSASKRPDFVASYANLPMQRRPSFGNISVCSSTAGSETGSTSNFLFDSNNPDGGFTFDAFGLDPQEIDREVQEAMQALAGSGHGDVFAGFISNSANSLSDRSSTPTQPQQHQNTTLDISGDDFAPQGWESPPRSSRHALVGGSSTPAAIQAHTMNTSTTSSTGFDDDEAEDGFVDGFRVTKPSPLPLVQVGKRYQSSPASSERSSSVSSITDHNTDGVPRRNVFKEKAGLTRSTPTALQKKPWQPPPGAVKLMSPPRPQAPRPPSQAQMLALQEAQAHEAAQKLEASRLQPAPSEVEDEEAESYWMDRLNNDPSDEEQRPQNWKSQPSAEALLDDGGGAASRRRWQSAAAKYASPQPAHQPPQQYKKPLSQPSVQPQSQWVLQEGYGQHQRLVKQHDQQESFEADFEDDARFKGKHSAAASARPTNGQVTSPKDEEKKDDSSDASNNKDKDSHTDATEATTAFTANSSHMEASPAPASRGYVQQRKAMFAEPAKPTQQQSSCKANAGPLKKENLQQLQEDLDQLEDELRADLEAVEHVEILKQSSLSPQEQRRKELEELRSGGSSSSLADKIMVPATTKSQASTYRSDSPKLLPQQQRVAECNDQRTSLASVKERLKATTSSKVDDAKTTPQSSNTRFRHSVSSPAPYLSSPTAGAKSEVGVSSFARQKLKIVTSSSASTYGSKSEVGTPSPKLSEANAILNRMRGFDATSPHSGSSSSRQKDSFRKSQSDVGQERPPAFLGVKLKKTTPPPALQERSPRDSDSESQDQQHAQQAHSYDDSDPGKKMTYRELREFELKKEEERRSLELDRQSNINSSYQYTPQKVSSVYGKPDGRSNREHDDNEDYLRDEEGHFGGSARKSSHSDSRDQSEPSQLPPKKLTYRERRELELQREKEEQRKLEEEQKGPPRKDVASLIRQRVAANRKSFATKSSDDTERQTPSPPFGKSMLRPTPQTSIDAGESVSEEPSDQRLDGYHDDLPQQNSLTRGSYDSDLRTSSHDDKQGVSPRHSPRHARPEYDDIDGSSTYRYSQHEQTSSPRHSTAPRQVAGPRYDDQQRASPRHLAPQLPARSRDNDVAAVHKGGIQGVTALHAQLKTRAPLQDQTAEDDQALGNQSNSSKQTHRQAEVTSKAATRFQALIEDKSDSYVPQESTGSSPTSEQHDNISPSRTTPKATYAMLNAFLHGREAIANPIEHSTPSPTSQDSHGGSFGEAPESPTNTKIPFSADETDGRPALKDDPKYARYIRMLKVGMPLEVVKHAIERDGMDPSVLDGDHNKPACIGIPLKDDPTYAKYFKMLKIGMPMEAVKHAMERDGLDSHVMDQDHNLPAKSRKDKKVQEPKERDSHRRSRLHWKPLREFRSNSLWAKIDQDPELDNLEIDEEEFAELFQAELETNAGPSAATSRQRSPRKGAAVRVIDPKRANNGGIVLSRLKMSHDDMADAVDRIDENSMTAEQIEHIIEYLPSMEERKALEHYMLEGGQDASQKFESLCECEKFMVSMMTVKHAKRKVRALLFKLQFESCLEALAHETNTVETSCDELSNSVRLRQLLGIVLTFGNRLNTAGKGKKKKAGAFTLDSLLKLNQTKAFDKKTTFLHYIVLIVQRNNELLLKFKDDLPTVLRADKVFWDQCVSDLEEVENQLENVRRIALHQAHHHHNFRVRKRRTHRNEDDDDESLDEVSLSLEQEVEALRSTPIGLFTLYAIKKVSFLRDRVEETKSKFLKLLEYFGEEEKSMQPHELFAIIVRFCKDFEKAKEQVYANEKRKKREDRKRLQANANARSTPNKSTPKTRHGAIDGRPPHHSTGMPKLSSMQPNASRVLDDIKRSSVSNPPAPSQPQARSFPAEARSANSQPPAEKPSESRSSSTAPEKPMAPNSQTAPPPAPSLQPKVRQPRPDYIVDNSEPLVATSLQSSPRRRQDGRQVELEDVIPKGMQEQGRMDVSFESGSAPTSANAIGKDASFDSEGSNLSQLRRRAKLRLQQRANSNSSSSTPLQEQDDGSTDDIMQDPVAMPQDPDNSYDRQNSSLENVVSNDGQRASTNISNHSSMMRAKLRSKRMLERKQRLMASPP